MIGRIIGTARALAPVARALAPILAGSIAAAAATWLSGHVAELNGERDRLGAELGELTERRLQLAHELESMVANRDRAATLARDAAEQLAVLNAEAAAVRGYLADARAGVPEQREPSE